MLRNIEGKTPDEVMATFKPDWRNRIRKAPRKGVYCKACGTEALDDFYPLMQATGIRDGFSIRSKEYFVKMLNGLGPEHCRLFMCYVDEDGKQIPLSGAVTTQYAGKTCYVYGASANHHRNLYPNYLMQWTMITIHILNIKILIIQ
jgi:lipid II:glycine glycyltransferase (peptidoglycan interpeptide bridge formation enzyme)